MITSSFIYRGAVTIKVKNKPPVKQHNEGTNALFNALLYTLIEGYSASAFPKFMTILSTDLTEEYHLDSVSSPLVHEMVIIDKRVESDTAKFKCVLTKGNITDELNEGPYWIYLLDGNQTHVLAKLQLDKDMIDNINSVKNGTAGLTQADIIWELSFSNPTKEETGA